MDVQPALNVPSYTQQGVRTSKEGLESRRGRGGKEQERKRGREWKGGTKGQRDRGAEKERGMCQGSLALDIKL